MKCVFAEISHSEFGKKVVGAVYRPHNSTLDSFNIDFKKVLNLTNKSKAEYIFAGDYNIDLLKLHTHDKTASFVNNVYAHSCLPVITSPTRFGEECSTLIDNIFTNKPSENIISGLLIDNISDHLPIFYISRNLANGSKYITIKRRIITDEKIMDLKKIYKNWIGQKSNRLIMLTMFIIFLFVDFPRCMMKLCLLYLKELNRILIPINPG